MSYGSGPRIVIKNPPSSLAKDDFSRYFSTFGTVSDVYFPTRGDVVFVTYDSEKSVLDVLATSSHSINGNPLQNVERAAPRGSKGGGGGGGSGYYQPQMQQDYGMMSQMAPMGNFMKFSPSMEQHLPAYSNASNGGAWGRSKGETPADLHRIFVKDIPATIGDESIRSYFAQYGDLADVYVPKNPSTGVSKGIAYIKFEDPTVIQKVLNVGATAVIAGAVVSVTRAEPRAREAQQASNIMGYHDGFSDSWMGAMTMGSLAGIGGMGGGFTPQMDIMPLNRSALVGNAIPFPPIKDRDDGDRIMVQHSSYPFATPYSVNRPYSRRRVFSLCMSNNQT